MAKIIYFGTNGCSGHYPIGIDMTLTGEEYNKWCECDNEVWIENIRKTQVATWFNTMVKPTPTTVCLSL